MPVALLPAVLLCGLAAALGDGAAPGGGARLPDVVGDGIRADDECGASPDGEACAVSAMQLRGRRVVDAEVDSLEMLSGESLVTLAAECHADPLARLLSRLAPSCAEACLQLCEAALPVLAAVRGAAGAGLGADEELCARRASLACALAEENAEACSPLLEEASLLGAMTPRTASELEERCARRSPPTASSAAQSGVEDDAREALRAALLQRRSAAAQGADGGSAAHARLLDVAMSGKSKDSRCKGHSGKRCVSKHTWIVCELGYKVSGHEVSCENTVGAQSICRDRDQANLEEDFCDDPFCRNGGAYEGNGKYCQKDHLIYCNGGDAPRVINMCSDQHWTDKNGTRRVNQNHCVGAPPYPDCMY